MAQRTCSLPRLYCTGVCHYLHCCVINRLGRLGEFDQEARSRYRMALLRWVFRKWVVTCSRNVYIHMYTHTRAHTRITGLQITGLLAHVATGACLRPSPRRTPLRCVGDVTGMSPTSDCISVLEMRDVDIFSVQVQVQVCIDTLAAQRPYKAEQLDKTRKGLKICKQHNKSTKLR